MKDRQIKVRNGHILSDPVTVHNGVPQGSVLSPLLFGVLVNDISQDISSPVKVSQFVDDVAMWSTHVQNKYPTQRIQNALNKVSKWAEENQFTFSPGKCESMWFSKTEPHKPVLKIFLSTDSSC